MYFRSVEEIWKEIVLGLKESEIKKFVCKQSLREGGQGANCPRASRDLITPNL